MERDAAWLAGFFDGEGTFSIGRKHQRNGRIGLRAQASLGGTDMATLQHIEGILNLWDIRYHVHWRNWVNVPWKPFWHLRIDSQERIGKLLDRLGGYLVTKRAQADLMRRFIGSRGGLRGKTARYTDAERVMAEAMRLLNKRGTLVEDNPTPESIQAPAGEWPVGSGSESR